MCKCGGDWWPSGMEDPAGTHVEVSPPRGPPKQGLVTVTRRQDTLQEHHVSSLGAQAAGKGRRYESLDKNWPISTTATHRHQKGKLVFFYKRPRCGDSSCQPSVDIPWNHTECSAV